VGSSSRPTAYAATQRAIEVLSDALVAELGDGDVLVSCIQPGLVKTGAHHRWEIEGASGAGYPLEPEDFARMVLFILEEAAGGRTAEEHIELPASTAGDESAEDIKGEVQEVSGELEGAESSRPNTDDAAEEGFLQNEA
jgi:NAD(P)-dependent dehydrogenase (short-subunit alcohol dehydrogenase family)